jgi:hypothetical protein
MELEDLCSDWDDYKSKSKPERRLRVAISIPKKERPEAIKRLYCCGIKAELSNKKIYVAISNILAVHVETVKYHIRKIKKNQTF